MHDLLSRDLAACQAIGTSRSHALVRKRAGSRRHSDPGQVPLRSPIVIRRGIRYRQLMTDKAQVKAILHGLMGETMEVDLEGPPFQRTIEGNWFSYLNGELLPCFDYRLGQDETSLEQHYDFRENSQAVTDKPQVIAIAHLPTGETLKVEIEGPPFPTSLPGSMFPLPMQAVNFIVLHRPEQDPESLEQHYDSDTGYPAGALQADD